MNYKNQNGVRDCFPTCIYNAMHHFNVPIIPALRERFEVFNNGTENCTIYSSEERLEQYYRSIHKLISEWNWASRHKDDADFSPESEKWALYLLNMGITIEIRNGPLEHKELITESLVNDKVVICETSMPSEDVLNSGFKHFVLIIKLIRDKLFIHDPFPANLSIQMNSIEYGNYDFGSNLVVDCNYFFSNDSGPMKPEPNIFLIDSGYKFIIISKL